MDDVVIRLVIVVAALVLAVIVNYHALAMADLPRSKIRNVATFFGATGLFLVILLPFLPLLTLFAYFSHESIGAEGMAVLFNAVLIGAVVCSLGSSVSLLAKSIADREREA